MVTLHRTGRRVEALSAYDRLRELLHRELGAAPSAAVRQLHSRIRAER
jgi:DNA-binding SARP family transcriptional activator